VNVVFGLFLVAHGLVHALYAAHALRLLEISPGLLWPDASWALAAPLGDATVRSAVAVVFLLVAAGFAVSGVALVLRGQWWQVVASAAAVVSTIVLVLVWNGVFRGLGEQGLYAIVINVFVVVSALVVHWPRLAR